MLEKVNIDIVAEEQDFLLINKPPGIGMHNESAGDDTELGLISLLRSQCDDHLLFPVHRLDKVTSGLLIVAKGTVANKKLSALFREQLVSKYYLAISHKKPKKKQGRIAGDMVSGRNGSWRLLKTQEKPAVTQFFSYGLGEGARLFVVKLYSGKTHQIRVALKSLGSPILGDERYGAGCSDRTYLHAYKLHFDLNQVTYSYMLEPKDGESFRLPSVVEQLSAIGDPHILNWPLRSNKF